MRWLGELTGTAGGGRGSTSRFASDARMRSVNPLAPPHRASHLEPLEPRLLLSGSLLITEFMADNKSTLMDEDGAFSDWIELQNTSAAPINLQGWQLADSNSVWTFPAKTLAPGEFIVVFASNKNRTDPVGELHTNFALAAAGERLQLIQPGGEIEQSFDPFPEQFEDISYGLSQAGLDLVPVGAALSYLIPTAGDAAIASTWMQTSFDDAAFKSLITKTSSTVLITEIATGAVDFLEIHNVSVNTVDTTGWVLAVSDGTSINTVDDTVRALPPSLASNQVTYYSESGLEPPANQWGSSIGWGTTTAGWALLLDSGGTVVDFVIWGHNAAAIATFNVMVNGFNITAANLPWSGGGVSAAGGTLSNSMKRTGTSDADNSSNFAFTPGQTKGVANTNLITPFPEILIPATTGIGYSAAGAASGFDVTYYKANVAVNSLDIALGVISNPSQQTQVVTGKYDTINFYNTSSTGLFPGDVAFPGTIIGVNVDDFVIRATTQIVIPTAGVYTFGVRSDDGFGLSITGAANFNMSHPSVRGPSNSLSVFDFPVAGVYDLTLTYFERGGGSELEMFAAEGSHAAFGPDFKLVGDVAAGGLAIAGFAGDIQTNVFDEMNGVNSSLWTRIDFNVDDVAAFDSLLLQMKYDAGFVAYINGVEVARRNAPGTPGTPGAFNAAATLERPNDDVPFFESINITGFLSLLQNGANVLAIHGLNSSAADDDFLLLPQLVAASTQGSERYFDGPTPGATNSAGFLAFVEDTKFSHDRGFYDAPFNLVITSETAGAIIRYTTDGSPPTPTHGTLYTGPVTISQSTTLRAMAYKPGFEPTNVDTHTYFFLADLLTQSADGSAPPGWPSTSVNGQQFNYGMDPDIVNDPVWGPQMAAALTSIPSISIVTDLAHLVDPTTGIYVNAQQDGALWERPTSLELIDPLGLEEGFQIDAGLRIRGGFSRSGNNPKHSFRLFFRKEYGGDLFYALFGDEGADRFDKVDLRTSQNYSWAFQNDARNIMNRDVFFRDLQRDMEDPYTRSRYYHLYLNGQYWGLYQTQERAEANFAATYFGGDPDDYDVVKVDAGPYVIDATDGNLDAWNSLWTLATQGFNTNEKYYRVLGRNADGTRNAELPVYVDQISLIDYMIGILWGGNLDAPISNFLSNNSPNNWYGIYNRTTADQGFKFFAHDSEHTLLTSNLNTNRNGPVPAGDVFNKSNPQWLHQQLMEHEEYRMLFADRVQLHMFNDGALTVENNLERFLERAAQIETAIIAESARWGDSKRTVPFTKANWQAEINNLVNNYFPHRNNILLNQLRTTVLRSGAAAPLFPALNAPSYNVHGGNVGQDFDLYIEAAGRLVYYTLDGTDPRLPGGGINPLAVAYDPGETSSTIIATGSPWKYLDNGSNQDTAWRNAGFNDTAWATGNAQLGYGDGDEATVVSFGSNAAAKHVTTYFRNTFNLTDVDELTALTLRLLRDDGAVVYLNGQEIVRSNMPAGTIAFNTLASSVVGGADENTFYEFNLDPALLLNGVNTLAVEVHQVSADSSDLSFDLELVAQRHIEAALTLTGSGPVNARVFDGSTWSALTSAVFQVNAAASAQNLAVTEINYNPLPPTAAELALAPGTTTQNFEFIELRNIGEETIDLFGVRFTIGIEFDFTQSSIFSLAPGEHVIVVVNLAAFEARYGTGLPVAGVYTGNLNNNGERLLLVAANDAPIADIVYSDTGDWPGRPDGRGSSLERKNTTSDYNNGNNWRASSEVHGSPGRVGLGPDNRIVFNEILSHTDLPLVDSAELYNTTGGPLNIGGWFMSDTSANLSKYRIPNGTIIAADGYLVFNANTLGFNFDAALGEEAYLVEADPVTGQLLRFVDVVSFGAQANGESWGRYPNGTGDLTPMLTRTLGSANGEPRIGPVFISEIMYNPPEPPGGLPVGMTAQDLEFIEIYNPTPLSISLTEWRIRTGIEYNFAADTQLPPFTARVIVSFDPADPLNAAMLAAFRSFYGLSAAVPLLGPYTGRLANDGETVRLLRPDEPPTDQPLVIPRLLEDRVDYSDNLPWPKSPDGQGDALHRRPAGVGFGSFARSWYAGTPTPGSVSNDSIAPRVVHAQVNSTNWSQAFIDHLHLRSMGNGGLTLATQGAQLTPLPWTNLNILTLRFTEDVIIQSSHLALAGVNSAQAAVAAFHYDAATFTATWTLASGMAHDKWLIHLPDAVTDRSGNPLDGEWTTGSTTFAQGSGNGVAGGHFQFRFNTLPGEVTGNTTVNSDDMNLVRAAQFRDTAHPLYNPHHDISGDSIILSNDVILVRNRQSTTLPAGEPLVTAPLSFSLPPAAPVAHSTTPTPTVASVEIEDTIAGDTQLARRMALLASSILESRTTPQRRPASIAFMAQSIGQMPPLWRFVADRVLPTIEAIKRSG